MATMDVTEVGGDARGSRPVADGYVGVGGAGHGRTATATTACSRDCDAHPPQVRAALPDGRVLGVIADRPLHRPQIAQIAHAARAIGGHVLVLIPVAEPGPDGLPAETLVRTVLAAADRLPPAEIVAVPLRRPSRRGPRRAAAGPGRRRTTAPPTCCPRATWRSPAAACGCWCRANLAYDTRDGQWRASDDIPPRFQRVAMTPAEIDDLLDDGAGAARMAHAAVGRPGTRPGPAAPPYPWMRRVLHRPVRLGQVDGRPRRRRRAAGDRRAHGHVARRRRGPPRAVRRPDVQQGRPGPQHPPDRLGRGRGRPARRHGDLLPDRSVRGGPRDRPGAGARGRGRLRAGARRDAARGLRSSATARACTRRPEPA